jgi:hypothetical protein
MGRTDARSRLQGTHRDDRRTAVRDPGGVLLSSIHLATALALLARGAPAPQLVFVTADRGLVEAARGSGLVVFNPLLQRPEELESIAGAAG